MGQYPTFEILLLLLTFRPLPCMKTCPWCFEYIVHPHHAVLWCNYLSQCWWGIVTIAVCLNGRYAPQYLDWRTLSCVPPPIIWWVKSSWCLHRNIELWILCSVSFHQNAYFILMLTKKLQLLGTSSGAPDPLPKLCPWTPLEDFHSQVPCYIPLTMETDQRLCLFVNRVTQSFCMKFHE